MPVFESHLSQYQGSQLGKRIRDERQKEGLTLKQLADRLRISQAKLSNIETGKMRLDLGQLREIAVALDVPLAALFPRSRVYYYVVKRSQEIAAESPIARKLAGPVPGPATHHNLVWPLAGSFVGKHMEPALTQIHPLSEDELYFIAHDHEEFVFVLRGEVETLLKTNEGVVVGRLSAGDCMYFNSYLPHCHRSILSEPAETLTVSYSLRGAIDPEDGEISPSGHQYYRRTADTDPTREAGEKIALLRRSRGLTLPDLAKDLGIGPRHLAQVERGERPPHVDLLLALARMFRRPVEYFLATTLDAQPHHFIQRKAEIVNLPVSYRKADGNGSVKDIPHVFRALAIGFPDRGIHPYYLQVRRYAPNQEPSPRAHYGQEFIYVLDGEVELITQMEAGCQERELLRPGDALFLESSVPHLLRGHSRNPYAASMAEVIDVFWSPLGESYLFSPRD